MEKIIKSFFDTYSNDFFEYFDKQRLSKIMQEKDYREINQQICNLKRKYPKVILFLENKEYMKLNYLEEKTINKIIKLQEELNSIEIKEAFKLGFKEALIYFDSMNMLNYK